MRIERIQWDVDAWEDNSLVIFACKGHYED